MIQSLKNVQVTHKKAREKNKKQGNGNQRKQFLS